MFDDEAVTWESAFCKLGHLISMWMFWGNFCYFCPNLYTWTYEYTKANEDLNNMSMITGLTPKQPDSKVIPWPHPLCHP